MLIMMERMTMIGDLTKKDSVIIQVISNQLSSIVAHQLDILQKENYKENL